jgi:hypothetical protein
MVTDWNNLVNSVIKGEEFTDDETLAIHFLRPLLY